MSKKLVKITNKGVVESVSGNSQELPSSAEFRLESSFVDNILSVATLSTGTVASHSAVFAVCSSRVLVVLPAAPTHGQKVTIYAVGGSAAVGVSASHGFNGYSNKGIGVSSSNGFFARDFAYLETSLGNYWISPGASPTGDSGASGTYNF